MKTKKNDFIEIDFVARIKDSNVFDTTKPEEAKKTGLMNEKNKGQFKPLAICIGQGMTVEGLDKGLEDKELDIEYEIELKPEQAFGLRNAKLVRTVPLSAFKELPQQGMFVSVNDMIARVISITSGRVVLDFNNPLAGKHIVYKLQINKIIQEAEEKIKILASNSGLELSSIKIENSDVKIELKGKKEKGKEKELELFKKKVKELMNLNVL